MLKFSDKRTFLKWFKKVYTNNLTVSGTGRNQMLVTITNLLNAGGAGWIYIMTGVQPATPDTALSGQTILAALRFSATSFMAPSTAPPGSISAYPITSATAGPSSGTATWARLTDGTGTSTVPGVAVMDCTVGTSGSDINFPTTTINAGDTVSISSFTLNHP